MPIVVPLRAFSITSNLLRYNLLAYGSPCGIDGQRGHDQASISPRKVPDIGRPIEAAIAVCTVGDNDADIPASATPRGTIQ